MHQSYLATQRRGKATRIAFGKFRSDAHSLFGSRAGERIWQAKFEASPQEVGLPHEVVMPQYGGPPAMSSP